MKPQNLTLYFLLIPIGVVVFLDEWVKYWALVHLPGEETVVQPRLVDFVIHRNYGIAFDIPFRLEIIIAISLLIGFGLLHMAYKQWRSHIFTTLSVLMIIMGAMGNLYDRISYGFTVDYILLFGRSAINLSDLIIILGVFLLLMSSRKRKSLSNHAHTHIDNHVHS